MHLSFNGFLERKNISPLNGMYVFSSDSCGICNIYKKNLATFPYDFDYVDIALRTEKDELFRTFTDSSLPFTVVYKDGNVEYIKNGILMEYQFKELRGLLQNLKFNKQVNAPLTPSSFKNILLLAPLENSIIYYEDCISKGEIPFCIKSWYIKIKDKNVSDIIDKTINEMFGTIVVYGVPDSTDALFLLNALQNNKTIIYRKL